MGSYWDVAIPQAMQRHSGCDWSKPNTAVRAPELVPQPETPAFAEVGRNVASVIPADTVKAG